MCYITVPTMRMLDWSVPARKCSAACGSRKREDGTAALKQKIVSSERAQIALVSMVAG